MLNPQVLRRFAPEALFTMCLIIVSAVASAAGMTTHTSKKFQGVKANTGTVTHAVIDGKDVLTLSDDFKTPDTPAPHWQIVDSAGNVYLLQRLMVKDGVANMDKLNKSIVVPSYIRDIANVQIWCAFAETLLGETTFDSAIMLGTGRSSSMADMHTSSMFMGVKANTGTVSHTHRQGQSVLTLSDDFKAPDAPAPHWQVVDSQGNTYLLQSLNIKGNKMNRSIVVPAYIHDVAKVQMWCAYAEVLLGEASFAAPVR
jgi:hypothetical protein